MVCWHKGCVNFLLTFFYQSLNFIITSFPVTPLFRATFPLLIICAVQFYKITITLLKSIGISFLHCGMFNMPTSILVSIIHTKGYSNHHLQPHSHFRMRMETYNGSIGSADFRCDSPNWLFYSVSATPPSHFKNEKKNFQISNVTAHIG